MTSTIVKTVKTSRKNIDQKKIPIKEKKKMFILGDSMFNFIQGWEIAKINHKNKNHEKEIIKRAFFRIKSKSHE